MRRLISDIWLLIPYRFRGIPIRIIGKLQAAIRYWKAHGFRAFLKRSVATLSGVSNIEKEIEFRETKFTSLLPLSFFTVPGGGRRLNLITDTIGAETLFGGLTPALILSALLAERWESDLRIITSTEQPFKQIFNELIKLNNLTLDRNVDFSHMSRSNLCGELPVGRDEFFLTTSWQSTRTIMSAFTEERIIYFLGDSGRALHQPIDRHLLSSQTLENPRMHFIVDSLLVYEHMISEGFENFRNHGLWFEPACPSNIFFPSQDNHKGKRNFFFYVQSDNFRALFDLGLKVIDSAISARILDPEIWDFYFVGKNIPSTRITGSYVPLFLQNISLVRYADLVRRMDVGLYLMHTPHPGYPILHLAASGAVAVTNKFGNKKSLDSYSRNILCRELDVHALVDGIEEAVDLAFDDDTRKNNFRNNQIITDWKSSFEKVLSKLERWPFHVFG